MNTLYKQNKTKQNKTISSSLYNKNIQRIDELMVECLGGTNLSNEKECIDEYLPKLSIDVIEYAMRETASRSGNWKYTKAILDSYIKQGIDTVEKAKAEGLKFKKNKGKKEANYEQRDYDNLDFLYANKKE